MKSGRRKEQMTIFLVGGQKPKGKRENEQGELLLTRIKKENEIVF